MSNTKTLKVPAASKGAASLIFFYYGDSKYTSMGQETLKLKKAMEGYKFKVLLKHETLPSWADLSEKDERLANIKDLPTRANLFKYIIQLAADGYCIDLFIFSHGWPGSFRASTGYNGSHDLITDDQIQKELGAAATGYTKMPIRIVWGTNCYGQTLGEAWRIIGAKATAGAHLVQFYPNAYGNFIDDWNKGTVSFESAVQNSQTSMVRTVAQTFIRFSDAPKKEKEGLWNGCPGLNSVLGDHDCAKNYFISRWGLPSNEWKNGMDGKEMMNHSSIMVLGGEKSITKNSKPRW